MTYLKKSNTGYAASANLTDTVVVEGIVTVSGETFFEVRHYGQVTKTVNGFGIGFAGPGDAEIYTQGYFKKLT